MILRKLFHKRIMKSGEIAKRQGLPNESIYQIFKKILASKVGKGSVILDAGCSSGNYAPYQMPSDYTVVGIDLDHNALMLNDKLKQKIRGDLQQIPLKSASCNFVVSIDVLEHLEKPELVMAEISRIMARGAQFIFTTPSKYAIPSIVGSLLPHKFAAFYNSLGGSRFDETYKSFYRINTEKDIDNILSKYGLCKECFLRHDSGIIGYLNLFPLLFRFGILLKKIVNKYSMLSFLKDSIISVYKKEGN